MEDDKWERTCKAYTADALGALLNGFRDEGCEPIPLFTELMKPIPKPQTADEIKAHILQRLME